MKGLGELRCPPFSLTFSTLCFLFVYSSWFVLRRHTSLLSRFWAFRKQLWHSFSWLFHGTTNTRVDCKLVSSLLQDWYLQQDVTANKFNFDSPHKLNAPYPSWFSHGIFGQYLPCLRRAAAIDGSSSWNFLAHFGLRQPGVTIVSILTSSMYGMQYWSPSSSKTPTRCVPVVGLYSMINRRLRHVVSVIIFPPSSSTSSDPSGLLWGKTGGV